MWSAQPLQVAYTFQLHKYNFHFDVLALSQDGGQQTYANTWNLYFFFPAAERLARFENKVKRCNSFFSFIFPISRFERGKKEQSV